MNIVKRQGTTTTKAKVMPSDFERIKKQFLSYVWSIVIMEDIPVELINWDQAGLKYVPVSDLFIYSTKPIGVQC